MMMDSLKILTWNKVVFTSIMALTSLPLSILIIWESMTTHDLTSQIHHPDILTHLAPTRFKACHVWKESCHDALSLLRTKALFSLPFYLLSLVAALFAIHSTLSVSQGNTPTLHSVTKALSHKWKCPFVTTIFIYAIIFAFSPVPLIFVALSASIEFRFLVIAIGSGLELYLMPVVSIGLVVSVAEDRFGWEAITFGSGLMEVGGTILLQNEKDQKNGKQRGRWGSERVD